MKSPLLKVFNVIGFLLVSAVILPAFEPIDPVNRWHVRDFYQHVYKYGSATEMQWTGNYASGDSGTVSGEWLEATRVRVNFFRAMAGIPSEIQFDPVLNAACQDAALMMSAAKAVSHYPDTSWPWYTPEGADAAQHGNLALGTSADSVTGPNAVTGYVIDQGPHNYAVGHRRWLLYPHSTTMGSGDAPGDGQQGGYPAANALWVIPEFSGSRPDTRDIWVAWPPRGYVPANLVFARWSFSRPDADFTNATVSMQSPGGPVPLVIEEVDSRFVGEPTIVWVPNGMDTNSQKSWSIPDEDTTYTITVDNIRTASNPQAPGYSHSYSVTLINPDTASGDEALTLPILTDSVYPTVPVAFSASSRPWAEGIQGRILRGVAYTSTHGAEGGDMPFIASIGEGYSPVQSYRVASGSNAFTLANPNRTPQLLTFDDVFLIGENAPSLQFDSSLAWATEEQFASVDLNLGDGDNWVSVWNLYGQVEHNPNFSHVNIDLSPWAGRTARIRFRYDFDQTWGYWDTHPSTGWAFDNISFSGVSRVSSTTEFSPTAVGADIMATVESMDPIWIQAREFAFGGLPLDWGSVLPVTPESYPGIDAPANQWIEDPVFGWISGSHSGWDFSFIMGWIYSDSFPWIWSDKGWFYYIRGSARSTLWLYHPVFGYAYTNENLGGWFNHQPYGPGDWKTFRD